MRFGRGQPQPHAERQRYRVCRGGRVGRGPGNKVVVAGRRKELLDEITAEHPGVDVLVLDVADPDSIARARETVAASHPGLNVLVNNAGIQRLESVLDPAGLQVAEDHSRPICWARSG
ncbi:SDR family NAD(P)-dependent oxidoreductase [Streptomyces sp. NBC_00444]|uniref:SDR family NAD(P)-dependent oxidoreductase n=1 Tax=Streptomyces sp. NBC_00444 TaxID=2975744 RepID=UPI002E21ABBC